MTQIAGLLKHDVSEEFTVAVLQDSYLIAPVVKTRYNQLSEMLVKGENKYCFQKYKIPARHKCKQ